MNILDRMNALQSALVIQQENPATPDPDPALIEHFRDITALIERGDLNVSMTGGQGKGPPRGCPLCHRPL